MGRKHKKRSFDICKENYNKEELIVFECITSYFVEIFYVHLYNEARKLKEDHRYPQINSITVGYKHSLRAWEQARKEKKFYKESIKGIVEKLKIEMGGMASYSMAIAMMVKAFIPNPEEWRNLSPEEQNNMLGTIIQNCVKQFIIDIMNKHVISIIDKRSRNTIEIIQDSFLQIIIDIKEYTESHLRISMRDDNSKKRAMIDQETYHRMKNFCNNLIIENRKQKKIIQTLQNIIKQRKERFDELQNELTQLKLDKEMNDREAEEMKKNSESYKPIFEEENMKSLDNQNMYETLKMIADTSNKNEEIMESNHEKQTSADNEDIMSEIMHEVAPEVAPEIMPMDMPADNNSENPILEDIYEKTPEKNTPQKENIPPNEYEDDTISGINLYS